MLIFINLVILVCPLVSPDVEELIGIGEHICHSSGGRPYISRGHIVTNLAMDILRALTMISKRASYNYSS